jgi:hypothetical protein
MFTKEELIKFYNRIEQYSINAYGDKPDKIQIYEDGTIYAIFGGYSYGEYEESSIEITLENLTEDLDEVAKKRKEKEEAERIQREIEEKKRKLERERIEKAERKSQYLKLKKEFEK